MSEQVASAAELDALPVGSVVLGQGGLAWQKCPKRERMSSGGWLCADRVYPGIYSAPAISAILGYPHGPAVVLYRPNQPQRVQPSREDVARLLAHQNADWIHGYLGADPATGETHDYGPRCSNWEPYAEDADAVLALFAQQPTVAEVARKAWARGYSDAMGDYEHSDPLPPNPYGESGADRCTSDVTLRNEGHRLVRCVLPEGHVEFHTDRRGTSWTGPEREARP